MRAPLVTPAASSFTADRREYLAVIGHPPSPPGLSARLTPGSVGPPNAGSSPAEQVVSGMNLESGRQLTCYQPARIVPTITGRDRGDQRDAVQDDMSRHGLS